jgi:hypothetical protein
VIGERSPRKTGSGFASKKRGKAFQTTREVLSLAATFGAGPGVASGVAADDKLVRCVLFDSS